VEATIAKVGEVAMKHVPEVSGWYKKKGKK
jgi:hypothetical protein